MDRAATFDETGQYRYRLDRRWDHKNGSRRTVTFVMLNPSTADAFEEDPTIRRCLGFARSLDCGGMTVVNLYGLRATDPKELKTHRDPIGKGNDFYIRQACSEATVAVVCAWGANEFAKPRAIATWIYCLNPYLSLTHCLGTTKSGAPRHPLYLPKAAPFRPFDYGKMIGLDV